MILIDDCISGWIFLYGWKMLLDYLTSPTTNVASLCWVMDVEVEKAVLNKMFLGKKAMVEISKEIKSFRSWLSADRLKLPWSKVF
jgi:hypothetical protein